MKSDSGFVTAQRPPGLHHAAREDVLEQEFQAHRLDLRAGTVRMGAALGAAGYVLFILGDLVGAGRQTLWPLQVGIWGLAVPSLLWLWYRSFGGDAARTRRTAVVTAWLHAALLLAAVSWGIASQIPVPYEGLLILLLFVFLLMGLAFTVAAPLAAFIVVAFTLTGVMAGLEPVLLVQRLFLLTGVALVGAVAAMEWERAERQSWLDARDLRTGLERDELTGLYSRRFLYEHGGERLRQARRDGKAVTLLIVDTDHFKAYNEAYGHLGGDDCLRKVTAQMNASVRRPLDLAARIGGEEFCVLLYDTPAQSGAAKADSIRAGIEGLALPHRNAPRGTMTVSIGTATALPRDEVALTELLRRADEALYAAKHSGRNAVRAWQPPGTSAETGAANGKQGQSESERRMGSERRMSVLKAQLGLAAERFYVPD